MGEERDWRSIRIDGVSSIERQAAVFQVWAVAKAPYAKFKVKVLERSTGGYHACPNIAVKSRGDRTPHWIDAAGGTIEEALERAVRHLMLAIDEEGAAGEDDFVYADAREF